MDAPVLIDSLWLTAPDSRLLPNSFDIEVSPDGENWLPIEGKFNRFVLPAFVSGNRAYLEGYYGRSEIVFPPVEARSLRLRLRKTGGRRNAWEMGEVFVFEHQGESGPVTGEEVETIVERIGGLGVDFTVADRWLSARLGDRLSVPGAAPSVYPRYDRKQPHTWIDRRFAPRSGLAVAVDLAVADECEAILAEAVSSPGDVRREDFGRYALFTFPGEGSRYTGLPTSLYWDGHVLLRAGSASIQQ